MRQKRTATVIHSRTRSDGTTRYAVVMKTGKDVDGVAFIDVDPKLVRAMGAATPHEAAKEAARMRALYPSIMEPGTKTFANI